MANISPSNQSPKHLANSLCWVEGIDLCVHLLILVAARALMGMGICGNYNDDDVINNDGNRMRTMAKCWNPKGWVNT